MASPKSAEQIKQEFQFTLSKVSHEIRNPITLINSYLQLVEKAHPEVGDYEYWEDILDQMDFLKKLLDELSFYNNSWKLNKEPLCISSCLRKFVEEITPTCHYLGITLYYEDFTLGAGPVLSMDAVKLRQALLNLVRNATESLGKNGSIHIILTEGEDTLRIQVTDNGCGIRPEYLPTLFDPFVTHKKNGTGLGLAIVRQVMQAHGGTVEVLSCPGQGTTFTLSFPCA